MKKIYVIGLTLAMGCNSSIKTVADSSEEALKDVSPAPYASTITESELKEHLYTYASDEFEGRETGKPGQKKAVDYIRTHYEDLGIPPAQKDNNYFQKVPLEMAKLPTGSLTIGDKTYAIGEDFITFSSLEGSFNELVYAGYGIEEENYSDYTNINVMGKLVLVKAGEPKNDDGTYLITGTMNNSKWSNMSESINKRVEAAMANGAKAILYYDPQNFKRYERSYKRMKTNDSGRLGFKADADQTSYVLIKEAMAKELMPSIEKSNDPDVSSIQITADLKSSNEEISTENVIAYIKGSEKPNEYVIISSHLDHIGVSANGKINNGADDDGSGTVAMLEIAEAFKLAADAGRRPKRSVVFLHVTGEEKGLLGSRYYTDYSPVFPLKQTVANLNIDMIGRIDPKREGDRNYVYLIGSDKLSSDLHKLSEEVNEKYTNITLDYKYNDENDPNRFYYRSDHYNFAKNNIPIIFYFNGTHDDYHRPGDTPDKINYDLMTNRARLVFYTAWSVANRDARVIVDNMAK